jgi:hypothetical protein
VTLDVDGDLVDVPYADVARAKVQVEFSRKQAGTDEEA